MALFKKNHLLFLTIIFLSLLIPMILIMYSYNDAFAFVDVLLGTAGIAIFIFSVYIIVSSFNIFLARILTGAVFILFLLIRIILSFVYDFSGRGFTSEFFAHFSWDSFLIGFQKYGIILLVSLATIIIVLYFLLKLIKHDNNSLFFSLLIIIISSSFIITSKSAVPEYRFFKALESYNTDNINDSEDFQTIRNEASLMLKPIRTHDELPVWKQDIQATPPSNPRNLILIYLESFSDKLINNPKYPGLTPNLSQLKSKYFSFDTYYSSGYVTIEGIASSQCGTIMNMDSGNSSLTSSSGQLPDLPCLGDILNKATYHQVFLGGADLEFTGKGDFLTRHGYDEVWGKSQWMDKGLQPENWWGLSDVDLFNEALLKVDELASAKAPFNLTLLTLGTHTPGLIYKDCPKYKNNQQNDEYLDAIYCTDYLVGKFITALRNKGILNNTIVQIQGDHGLFPTSQIIELFGDHNTSHNVFNVTLLPDDLEFEVAKSHSSTTLNLSANLLDLLNIKHNVNFILSDSDFKKGPESKYFISRYYDYYGKKQIYNYSDDTSTCPSSNPSQLTLPLNFCEKHLAINAIYKLNATYSGKRQNQDVCNLGVDVSINPINRKLEIKWGNQNLNDRFYSNGQTFKDAKSGFYLILLDQSDHSLNQIFFDYQKPNDMQFLSNEIKGENRRFFLISNLPTSILKALDLQYLPGDFSDSKMLYSQNSGRVIHNLFDYPYKTGKLKFLPHSCNNETEVVEYEPNPELDEVKFCDVKSWGPKKIVLGDKFNEQPNGDSAFWFKTDCAPAGTVIRFNQQDLKTVERIPTITARLDTDIYIKKDGKYPIELYHPETGTSKVIGEFVVLPNESYKPVIFQSNVGMNNASPPFFITHAAGGINNMTYVNSLQALDYNYKLGHRFFEMDFNWTSDNQLVAIHDWDKTFHKYFNSPKNDIPTLEEFLSLKMNFDQTQLDLVKLDQWLQSHEDAYIVTDIKQNNIKALKKMAMIMKSAPGQIIPQMYHPSNYQLIKAIGYSNIIFTLYVTQLPYYEIVDFVKKHKLFAVTVHPDKKDFSAIIQGVKESGTYLYVHTFNTVAELKKYKEMGINGFYTDFLYIDKQTGAVAKQ